MTPARIKPAIIKLLKTYRTLSVERIVSMTGFSPDSVRRVLREDPAFISNGSKALCGRIWRYNAEQDIPKKLTPRVKVEEPKIEYQEAIQIKKEKQPQEPYFTGGRIWGI